MCNSAGLRSRGDICFIQPDGGGFGGARVWRRRRRRAARVRHVVHVVRDAGHADVRGGGRRRQSVRPDPPRVRRGADPPRVPAPDARAAGASTQVLAERLRPSPRLCARRQRGCAARWSREKVVSGNDDSVFQNQYCDIISDKWWRCDMMLVWCVVIYIFCWTVWMKTVVFIFFIMYTFLYKIIKRADKIYYIPGLFHTLLLKQTIITVSQLAKMGTGKYICVIC